MNSHTENKQSDGLLSNELEKKFNIPLLLTTKYSSENDSY